MTNHTFPIDLTPNGVKRFRIDFAVCIRSYSIEFPFNKKGYKNLVRRVHTNSMSLMFIFMILFIFYYFVFILIWMFNLVNSITGNHQMRICFYFDINTNTNIYYNHTSWIYYINSETITYLRTKTLCNSKTSLMFDLVSSIKCNHWMRICFYSDMNVRSIILDEK